MTATVCIFLSPEVEAMLDGLLATGLYGDSRDDCATNLMLDQLKHVALRPGAIREFLAERKAEAEGEAWRSPPPEAITRANTVAARIAREELREADFQAGRI